VLRHRDDVDYYELAAPADPGGYYLDLVHPGGDVEWRSYATPSPTTE
jgi:hypothetical protein